jgi:hypothetical protein
MSAAAPTPEEPKAAGLIRTALEGEPGLGSSIRIQMFVVLFMVAVVPLGIWAVVTLRAGDGKLADIPGGVVTLCTLLAGASIGGKVFQHRKE